MEFSQFLNFLGWSGTGVIVSIIIAIVQTLITTKTQSGQINNYNTLPSNINVKFSTTTKLLNFLSGNPQKPLRNWKSTFAWFAIQTFTQLLVLSLFVGIGTILYNKSLEWIFNLNIPAFEWTERAKGFLLEYFRYTYGIIIGAFLIVPLRVSKRTNRSGSILICCLTGLAYIGYTIWFARILSEANEYTSIISWMSFNFNTIFGAFTVVTIYILLFLLTEIIKISLKKR